MATQKVKAGASFGRLLALYRSPTHAVWHCVCTCGTYCDVKQHRLLSGNTRSCGCLKRSVLGDATRTHGKANSRISGYASRAYGVWQAMRDRCSNSNRVDYKYYGGRGISVCARWQKFENFLEDMGEPPKGLTLDRVDNDKGYTKSNCRWATRREQTYNSTSIRIVKIGGVEKPLRVALAETGVTRNAFYARLKLGWTEIEALTTPLHKLW